MRLGAFSDFAYRRTPRGLEAGEAFVVFLAALAPHVDELVLIGRADPSTEPWHHRVEGDVRFAPLPHYGTLGAGTAARAAVGTVRRFWRLLDDLDAVLLFGPHPFSIVFALLALLRRRRVVLGVRQHLPAYVRHRHPGRRGALALALALEGAFRALGRVVPVVAVGPQLAHGYRRGRAVLAVPVSLVAADELAAPGAPPAWGDAPTVLSVGRLDAEKNPLLLADVLAALPAPWRLVVCGEGSERAALAARLEALGVASRAQLRGYVPVGPELTAAYRAADALLHVSWTEGFPQVLVEAFAHGLPVVATDVGGVRALAQPAALLVAPGDAAAAAAALRRLQADPQLRARLVAAGGAIAREHTLEALAERVARFVVG